jgi:hypothetical protein
MHVRTFFKGPATAPQPSAKRAPADADLLLKGQTLDHFIERDVLVVVNHIDDERLGCIQD